MSSEIVIDVGAQLDEVAQQLGDDPLGGTVVIEAIAFDPMATRLAIGLPGRVLVYALDGGKLVDDHTIDDSGAHAPMRLVVPADGKHVIAGCGQQTSNSDDVFSVFVLEERRKKPVLVVPGTKALDAFDWDIHSTAGVSAWAVSSDGARLATAWDARGVEVWSLDKRKRERTIIKATFDDEADPLEVSALTFSPDSDQLAVLVAGAIEVHPCGRGKRIARVEIDETFGLSLVAFTQDGLVWARFTPGCCETSVVDFEAGTVARRPLALDKVRPLRIDAASVLWLQEVGAGGAREQVLVRQDLVTGQLDPVGRTPWPTDPHYPRVHLAVSKSGDKIATIEDRVVRVTSLSRR